MCHLSLWLSWVLSSIVISANKAEIMWSFCHSDECGNRHRPNLASKGKGWPSRSDKLSVVIWSVCGFQITFSLSALAWNWGFLDICYISHTINGLFVPYLAKWLTPTRQCIHNILGQIQQTSGSGLIQKSGFESRVTFDWNFGIGRGLHSLGALVFMYWSGSSEKCSRKFYRLTYVSALNVIIFLPFCYTTTCGV